MSRASRNTFRRFFDLAKVERLDDESGAVRVTGILSSETPDEDGEIITADAMRDAIPEYMKFGAVREMHDEIAAGVMLKVSVGDDGKTYCEADIVEESTIRKLLHDPPILKGWSVGGKKKKRDPNNRKRITAIDLREASLVDRPCNHDATAELAKFSSNDTEEDEMDPETDGQAPGLEGDAPEKLEKGLYDVRQFGSIIQDIGYMVSSSAAEAVWEGDGSPVPAQLKKWLTDGVEIFKAMTKEETDELVAGLTVEIAKASVAEDLAKAGKKFSGASRQQLAAVGEHLDKASKALTSLNKCSDHIQKASEALKGTGVLDDDDDDAAKKAAQAEDLRKASGLTEELTTLRAEHEDLKKASGLISQELEDLKKSSDQLRKENEEAAALLSDLLQKRKGSIRAVAKADDLGTNTGTEGEDDLEKRAPQTQEEACDQARSLIARSIRSAR